MGGSSSASAYYFASASSWELITRDRNTFNAMKIEKPLHIKWELSTDPEVAGLHNKNMSVMSLASHSQCHVSGVAYM